jgi:hypothetical protein
MGFTWEQITGEPGPEPIEEIFKAQHIWSLDEERAKLERRRNAAGNGSS